MRVVLDIETNGLIKPDKIWVIVCKDIDTGILYSFRNVHEDPKAFLKFFSKLTLIVGHNILGYDLIVLKDILGISININNILDTLVLSKLIDYPRGKHSIEDYGKEFNLEKIEFLEFSKYSIELEEYCIRDVEINHKIYLKYLKVIEDETWHPAIRMEQEFQLVCNKLNQDGFWFNKIKADKLLEKVTHELSILDEAILKEFPPRVTVVKEFTPKATKFGTISKTSVPRSLWENIHEYEVGKSYQQTKLEPFNPSSHKQIIQVLREAGWKPTNKTKALIEAERKLQKLKRSRNAEERLQLETLSATIKTLELTAWKVDETNLSTLPADAPVPARTLAQRILLESRRRSLVEWLDLVQDDGRIHGKFYGIGAWTHRMAHQNPNTANIPGEFKLDGSVKLYGKEMRSLWGAPKGRLLVGVDAEGIQLRIFAHYINDPEFTESLVKGKKDEKTDPHSLNQRILGSVCKNRNSAKRFIFALLLGGGIGKLTEILGCTEQQTKEALDRLLERYTGFATLKQEIIPSDAKKGWFIGLDDRKVRIPGDTQGERKHLCMSGYLQNGEAVVMKKASLKWIDRLREEQLYEEYKRLPYIFVNMVHDEWQTEVPNDVELALYVAKVQAEAIREVGEDLKLNCPLAGSYWNDDHKDYTIGTNWYATH